MNRRTRLGVGVALVVALGSTTKRADAQGASNQAVAEALFEEARQLVAAGKPGDACPKFAESQRLDPAAGTLLNLANCYEKNGQTASAWVTFKDAEAEAKRLGRADWEKLASERSTFLHSHLSKLTIRVSQPAEVSGLEIRRDGNVVSRAEWGSAIPVDPGAHAVTVVAPGKEKWSTAVTIEPNGAQVTIAVPSLRDEQAAGGAGAASHASGDGSSGVQKPLGIVVGSLGVVGLVFGTVFGLHTSSQKKEGLTHCVNNVCDADGVQLIDDAHASATLSTVSFIAGGALVLGGAVLYFTAPRDHSAPVALRVSPSLGGASLGLSGSF